MILFMSFYMITKYKSFPTISTVIKKVISVFIYMYVRIISDFVFMTTTFTKPSMFQ